MTIHHINYKNYNIKNYIFKYLPNKNIVFLFKNFFTTIVAVLFLNFIFDFSIEMEIPLLNFL